MDYRRAAVVAGVAVLALAVTVAAVTWIGGQDEPPPIDVTAVTNGAGDDGSADDEQAAATPSPEPEPTPTPEPPGTHVQAVVSAHELATEAGIAVLERGGSAADAAVAVAAALSVVEPWFSSALGGGTWALYYDARSGTITSLDGVGPTGSLATAEDFRARGGQPGMHQANVPGAWDGWMLWLEQYGRLDLGQVLEPAIAIAREGYPIEAAMAGWMNSNASLIMARPSTAAIYAPNGQLLPQGATVHQHDMADTFEALVAAFDSQRDAGRGAAIQTARDHYYRGPIAEAIVDYSDRFNGYLTLEDFHGFEAQIVEPISIAWNDELTVYQNPPNSQGITMLLALNVLKDYELGELGADSADALHLQVEAVKLAFADRYYHVGDPARVEVPVAELLADEHASRQRARIDMSNAMRWPIADGLELPEPVEDAHTTTFHVVDRDGNGAAVTTSLGAQFLVIGDTGIHINNRMRFLAVDDGDPNQVAPGFKVRHTSNPYLVTRNDQLYILGGNTGADVQSQAQVQQFLNVVEFGLTAQEAVARPRFVVTSFPSTIYPYSFANTLRLEPGGFSSGLVGQLQARGHTIERVGGFGNANMIIVHDDQNAETGAEPRNGTSSGRSFLPE